MTYKIGDRVRVQGIVGTVVRVSPKLRFSVLVSFSDTHAVAFRPEELTKVEPPPSIMGMPLPGGTP